MTQYLSMVSHYGETSTPHRLMLYSCKHWRNWTLYSLFKTNRFILFLFIVYCLLFIVFNPTGIATRRRSQTDWTDSGSDKPHPCDSNHQLFLSSAAMPTLLLSYSHNKTSYFVDTPRKTPLFQELDIGQNSFYSSG